MAPLWCLLEFALTAVEGALTVLEEPWGSVAGERLVWRRLYGGCVNVLDCCRPKKRKNCKEKLVSSTLLQEGLGRLFQTLLSGLCGWGSPPLSAVASEPNVFAPLPRLVDSMLLGILGKRLRQSSQKLDYESCRIPVLRSCESTCAEK